MLIKRIILFLDINKDHLIKIKNFVNLINTEKLPITSLANENNKQIIYKFSDLLFRNIYIAKKCNINIQNTWINLNPEKIIYYNLKIIILTKHIMVCLK